MAHNDDGNEAVAMLATVVVLVLGAAFCSLIVLLVAENAGQALVISSCVIAGALCLIALLRGGDDSEARRRGQTWLRVFRKKKSKTVYRARRVKPNETPQEEWGQNRPPSLESIREIKQSTDGIKNWAPKTADGQSDQAADAGRTG